MGKPINCRSTFDRCKRAFDHFSRARLAQRMADLGIDDDLISWMQSFLTDR